MLRIIADDYEQAQRVRVGKGEQIRAIVQGREQQDAEYLKGLGYEDADALLDAILKGETNEPHLYLAAAYRQAHTMERAAFAEMGTALEEHPAWGWMSRVRGVGDTLGAKLLARLDLERAHNASSFWAYCGLATVPGQRWECRECGHVGIWPATFEVKGKHKGCKHLSVRTHGPEDGIRAAQPRSEKGEKRSYDAYAKKVLYLISSSWLKTGRGKSFYELVYREKVSYYERERPGWERGRIHYSALRVAEKLFLSHLYEAWCEAVGREPGECYAAEVLGHDGISTPDEVLEWEREARAG